MTSNDEDEPGRSRLRWLLGIVLLLSVPLTVIWWPGCRQYPAVTSQESLQHMKLLYAACNTRDTQTLDRVEKGVERLTQEGMLSPAEQQAFARIIGMAKAGDWERAEQAAFKFAQDQVGQGNAEPNHTEDHANDKKGATPKGKSK